MTRLAAVLAVILGAAVVPAASAAQTSCIKSPLALQVLGSGGPYAGGKRASTSYLVWRNGRAVVLIDAGGGSFLRFGEAGARLADLSLIAISHVHPDHVADLPALLWLSEGARQETLRIAGPSGGGPFPGIEAFLARLFDGHTGAFPGLSGTLGQPGRGVRLETIQVGADPGAASTILNDSTMEISALGVPHANVPSIAYRVRIGGRKIVFGSDQNGGSPAFSEFASDADLLVMHAGISEAAPEELARLHARPSTIGQLAQRARAKRLVLSHFMEPPPAVSTPGWFSMTDLDKTIGEIRRHYSGPVNASSDLQCFPFP